MQLNPSYLYPNKIDVYTNLGVWTSERYRKVYQRIFKTYRSVDNRLEFQVRNGDQKSKNITGYSAVFNLLATGSQELIKQKDCEILDPVAGKIFVTLTEGDMLDLTQGSYLFTVYLQDSNGVKTPLYGDSQFGAIGRLEVEGDMLGGAKESQAVTTFNNDGIDIHGYPKYTWTSELFEAKPEFNSNAGLHTFALYMTNYQGAVKIQGTLSDPTTDNWVDINTSTYTGTTAIDYINITGVWSYLRIQQVPVINVSHNPVGTIDKILYRY
jgi:BppU N-terminal domain